MMGASLVLGNVGTIAHAQDASNLLLPPPTFSGNQIAPQTAATPLQATVQVPGAVEEPKVPDTSKDDVGFREALKIIAPMSPEQIEHYNRELDARDRARGKEVESVNSSTRSIRLSMKPGEMPPVIKVSPGWISTLTFSDVTGAPWPVMNVLAGNKDAYEALNAGAPGDTNMITISTRQAYVRSNLAVTLIGASVPVILTLDPTEPNIDVRVDIQVDQRGPKAAYDMMSGSGLAPTNDSTMLAFLDGVAPDGAKKLQVADREVQAWRYDDQLYIRTSRTMLSPAYISKQSNVSGTNVYVLNEAPVLLFSDNGRMFSVMIKR
jgi:intracellular multiplication protein IcmK